MRNAFIVVSLFISVSISFPQSRFMPPPDARVETRDGNDFLSGEIFMADHADTLALKKMGFRHFQFVGRAFGSVKYHARWPLSAHPEVLPATISGINYDCVPRYGDESAEWFACEDATERYVVRSFYDNYSGPYNSDIYGRVSGCGTMGCGPIRCGTSSTPATCRPEPWNLSPLDYEYRGFITSTSNTPLSSGGYQYNFIR